MNCVKQGQGSLSWKAALLSCSRVSYGCAWKIQGRSLSLAPVRTVNRNRSPRLKASGRQNNVGKGSRQNRSVTSGKGLAPRLHAGVGVDRIQGLTMGSCVRRFRVPRAAPCVFLVLPHAVPTMKQRLGTVTNKGNLTG